MKHLFLLLLLLFPVISHAELAGYGTTYYGATDSGANTENRYVTYGAVNKNISVGFYRDYYNNPIGTYYSNGIETIFNINEKNDHSLIGYAGLAVSRNKPYLIGDLTYTKTVNKNLDLFVGGYSDIVNSYLGLINVISMTGIIEGADIHNKYVGVASLIRETHFSDGNAQTGYLVKPYVNVFDGFGVYVEDRMIHNSNPYNGNYFAPDYYRRDSVGIQFRKKYDGILVYGFIEDGTGNIDGQNMNVYAWRLLADKEITQHLHVNLMGGHDMSASTNYQYRYFMINFNYMY